MHINEDITLEQVELAEATLNRVQQEADKGHESGWAQKVWATAVEDPDSGEFWDAETGRYRFSWVGSGSELPIEDLLPGVNICGTAGCFAGWTVALSGRLVVADGSTTGARVFEIAARTDRTVTVGAQMDGTVDAIAASLLGIESIKGYYDRVGDHRNEHIFDEQNKIGDLADFVWELRHSYETRIAHEAELAAEQLRLDATLEG